MALAKNTQKQIVHSIKDLFCSTDSSSSADIVCRKEEKISSEYLFDWFPMSNPS